jgi:enediyne biosynthesis thioesterase
MNINVTRTVVSDQHTRQDIQHVSSAPAFVYHHIVSFEETNLVGNVYFTRHISWQGRCREMFLKYHAPAIMEELGRDLRLVTLRVTCEYFEELTALDEIDVQMSLAYLRQHRIGLDFNFLKLQSSGAVCAARGFQEVGCMRATAKGLVPVNPPTALADALKPFMSNRSAITG